MFRGVVMMINILLRNVIKYRNTLNTKRVNNHALLAKKVNQMWGLESEKERQSWFWQRRFSCVFSVGNPQNLIYFSLVSISRSLSHDEEFPNNRERTSFTSAFLDRHRWL